jgi:hypothetical protein
MPQYLKIPDVSVSDRLLPAISAPLNLKSNVAVSCKILYALKTFWHECILRTEYVEIFTFWHRDYDADMSTERPSSGRPGSSAWRHHPHVMKYRIEDCSWNHWNLLWSTKSLSCDCAYESLVMAYRKAAHEALAQTRAGRCFMLLTKSDKCTQFLNNLSKKNLDCIRSDMALVRHKTKLLAGRILAYCYAEHHA